MEWDWGKQAIFLLLSRSPKSHFFDYFQGGNKLSQPLMPDIGRQIMKDQIGRKLSEDVRAMVINTFSAEFHLDAIDALSRYGIDEHERESGRVQLAILSLCGGSLDRLKELVAEAKMDYRNILYWNEQTEK